MVLDKNSTCCFTGHRYIPANDIERITKITSVYIEKLTERGYTDFICGGALGFDILAEKCVLWTKRKFPERTIRLHLFIPCRNQTRGWHEAQIREYNLIMQYADTVTYISENYFSGCMHKRNRAMVDESSVVISYCIKNTGGSAYTTKYALENGKKIVSVR